jgi:hypothetical protein
MSFFTQAYVFHLEHTMPILPKAQKQMITKENIKNLQHNISKEIQK